MQPDFSFWHRRPKCKSFWRLAEIISSEQRSGGSLIHIPLERDFISLNSKLDSLSKRSGKMLHALLSPFSNATTCLIYNSWAFLSHKKAMHIDFCFQWKANDDRLICVFLRWRCTKCTARAGPWKTANYCKQYAKKCCLSSFWKVKHEASQLCEAPLQVVLLITTPSTWLLFPLWLNSNRNRIENAGPM